MKRCYAKNADSEGPIRKICSAFAMSSIKLIQIAIGTGRKILPTHQTCKQDLFSSFTLRRISRISQSPIWDPVTGFGGNGVAGTYTVPPDPTNTSRIFPNAFRGCVRDGPFANYTLKMGPGLLVTEHCLTRGFDNSFNSYLTSSNIAHVMSFPTYVQFLAKLEGFLTPTFYFGPHIGGHYSVGGEMNNFFSSPGG